MVEHLLQANRSCVQSALGEMLCVLEQDALTTKRAGYLLSKRQLCHNMIDWFQKP